MAESQVKFRIKIGQIEIEYEGGESFLRDDLANLTETVPSLLENAKVSNLTDTNPTQTAEGEAKVSDKKLDLSTSTIASRLEVKKGSELVLAAAAHLSLCEGRSKFSRSEILSEMKTATAHYKSTMNSNLTSTLNRLVKSQRLNEISTGDYALTASEIEKLEKSLAS